MMDEVFGQMEESETEFEQTDEIEAEFLEEQIVGLDNNHVHTYEAQNTTVTHPATGHYERAIVRYDMTTDFNVVWNMILNDEIESDEVENIYENHVVCTCGEWLDVDENGNKLGREDTSSNIWHHASTLGHSYSSELIFLGYKYPVYEDQWVEDKAAWTETVVKNYKCSGCGETHNTEPVNIGNGVLRTIHAAYEYTGQNRNPKPTVYINGKKLVEDVDYNLYYSNNKELGMATVTADGIGDYTGSVSTTFEIVEYKLIPIYRLYNPGTGEHFYTKNPSERDACVRNKWRYEGIAWYAPEHSEYPVYRVCNPNGIHMHHYTTNKKERDWLVNVHGWRDEGISFYSTGTKDSHTGVPVYRLYNPNSRHGDHHYTKSEKERDFVRDAGWNYEGICWYVPKISK